jgi:SAM-dependent methyltransferase
MPPETPRGWAVFFDRHAPHYEQNPFTHHTVAEVDFLLTLFPLPPGATILDVGCGTGRHARELTRRGFRVTGVDVSPGMLAEARRKAAEDGLEIEFLQADATDFALDRTFDAALCLCEGGVGLLDLGESAEQHDRAIFTRIYEHLRPGAPFLLTALNGYATIRQMNDQHIAEGRFNPATMESNYLDEMDLPEGMRVIRIYERLFIAPEMVRLLESAGFRVENVFGGTAGHWARRFLSLDEVEAMYVCRRS